ncbi:MAG: hypothetical protein PWP11_2417, partial [Thauera sp.]|nr:hypothetical protein [Thauera sp.]
MRLEIIDLALVSRAHGATGTVQDRGVVVALGAQLCEFAVAGFENALHAAGFVAGRCLEQGVEVAAAPEIALELVGLGARGADL